jgi:hypothetical protein
VAKSSLGKIVSRVGASGGGKTYAKARPATYYAVLTIIVVLGLASVVYSRYERAHPVVVSTAFPAKGSLGYFALALDACGTVQPELKSAVDPTSAFDILTSNVVRVTPTTASQANGHANVGAFISHTTGLSFKSNEITFPGPQGPATAKTTFASGSVCPAGSKYAGKKAYPEVAFWTSISQVKPTITNTPSGVVLSENMLVTIAFLPKGATPVEPSDASISALIAESPTTTTTVATTLPVVTTTTPSSTTTTKPVTTTTKPVTTTTKS